MLICESCHIARQARPAIESQPLQFTGFISPIHRVTGCPDCGAGSKGKRFEYLNAYELMGELEEAKEKLKQLEYSAPSFPLTFYESATDMLQHQEVTGFTIHHEDAIELLRYTAELEEVMP